MLPGGGLPGCYRQIEFPYGHEVLPASFECPYRSSHSPYLKATCGFCLHFLSPVEDNSFFGCCFRLIPCHCEASGQRCGLCSDRSMLKLLTWVRFLSGKSIKDYDPMTLSDAIIWSCGLKMSGSHVATRLLHCACLFFMGNSIQFSLAAELKQKYCLSICSDMPLKPHTLKHLAPFLILYSNPSIINYLSI